MTAIETVKEIMQLTGTTFKTLEDYADLGSMSNIMQMMNRNDLKTGNLVKMLETMGYRLVVVSDEHIDTFIVDC